MTYIPSSQGVRSAALGLAVERATAALPASTTADIFTVDGGRVLLVGIIGEVTTAIQAQACNLSVVYDPDGAGSNTTLASTLDVNADAAGSYYVLNGTAGGALVQSTNPFAVAFPAPRWVLGPGDIALTTSATNTGSVKWTALYVPLDDGATLTAV
jgi:hypothetical protein